jgi:predicted CopG family antitoxin
LESPHIKKSDTIINRVYEYEGEDNKEEEESFSEVIETLAEKMARFFKQRFAKLIKYKERELHAALEENHA